MFSHLADIITTKQDLSVFSKKAILTICTLNVELYIKLPVELRQDQEIIYVCLSCFKSYNQRTTLELLFENADCKNIEMIKKIASLVITEIPLTFILDIPNYDPTHLPYEIRRHDALRNWIYCRTTNIIQKEIVFAERYHNPKKLADTFKRIDIGKFTVKPRDYDVFIKIE